jgi:hypothetical protein
MTDIKEACTDGSCVCKVRTLAGFLDGAESAYLDDPTRMENMIALGNAAGVSEDRTP